MQFRKKIWCGDYSLKNLDPRIFALAANKEASVASYLDHMSEGEIRHWNLHFFLLWMRVGVGGFLF